MLKIEQVPTQVQHTIPKKNPLHRLHRCSSIIDESLSFLNTHLLDSHQRLSLSRFVHRRSSWSAAERWLLTILKMAAAAEGVVSSRLLLPRSQVWDPPWPNQLTGKAFEIPLLYINVVIWCILCFRSSYKVDNFVFFVLELIFRWELNSHIGFA